MINNLSVTNFEGKAKEFSEILKEQFYPWFAEYMVMKRFEVILNSCIYFAHCKVYRNLLDGVNKLMIKKSCIAVLLGGGNC